jgi:hypothetical protein
MEILMQYLEFVSEDFRGLSNLQRKNRIRKSLVDSDSKIMKTNKLYWIYDSESETVTIEHFYLDFPPISISLADLWSRLDTLIILEANGVS